MNYKQVDDLAVVWCEYGEMELRHENYEQALRILRVRHIFYLFLFYLYLCLKDYVGCAATEKGSGISGACYLFFSENITISDVLFSV